MWEYDESVVFEEDARMIGRVQRIDEPIVTLLEEVPKPYHQYIKLFQDEIATQMPPRRMWDHENKIKEGEEPPWGPIYPLSAMQLKELWKYLADVVRQGKIRPSQSTRGAAILFVLNED